MAGGYVYDDRPDEVLLDPVTDTKEADINPLSPCGKALAQKDKTETFHTPNEGV